MPRVQFPHARETLLLDQVEYSAGGALLGKMVHLALYFGVLGWRVDEGADGSACEASHHKTENAWFG